MLPKVGKKTGPEITSVVKAGDSNATQSINAAQETIEKASALAQGSKPECNLGSTSHNPEGSTMKKVKDIGLKIPPIQV